MKKIVMCDLDGTLYKSVGRSELAQAGEWEEFHEASVLDDPNDDVLQLLYALDEWGVEIIAITGRNEKFRNITIGWFKKHFIPITNLLMRPDTNFKPDIEVKSGLLLDWLDEQGRSVEDILFALEDRDKMVDGWRGMGINCYQVRAGEY